MSTVIVARGAIGEIARRVQVSLAALRFPPGVIDGIYGGKTTSAVQDFQRARGLGVTGEVDIPTWRELLAAEPPSSQELCLQLTAAFEGHGYTVAQGNFDGAGITWGVIGFTLKHGGIQEIVLNIHRRAPLVITDAFGGRADKLIQMMGAPRSQALDWADTISLGASKAGLSKPWKEAFARLGEVPEVQAEQLRLADERYFRPALATARRNHLATQLGVALCFDIHVQNGGIKREARQRIAERLAEEPVDSERDRRVVIANAVADSALARWREDVRSRKLTVALGAGQVHGRMYVLRNWGLSECPAT